MPKVFGREVPPVVLGGAVLLLGVLVYNELFPATSEVTARTRPKKSRTTTAANSTFTEEDYKAKFASYTEPVPNAFKPLVVKAKPVVGQGAGLLPVGVVPADLTGGEAGWTYGGYVEVDGVRQGVLENPKTGNSVFLRIGQRWKSLAVSEITADTMVVAGPGGVVFTIPTADLAAEQRAAAGVVPPGGVAAASGGAPLNGPIGGTPQGTAVPGGATPNALVGPNGTDLSVQPDMSSDPSTNFGRRRRGRRNN